MSYSCFSTYFLTTTDLRAFESTPPSFFILLNREATLSLLSVEFRRSLISICEELFRLFIEIDCLSCIGGCSPTSMIGTPVSSSGVSVFFRLRDLATSGNFVTFLALTRQALSIASSKATSFLEISILALVPILMKMQLTV